MKLPLENETAAQEIIPAKLRTSFPLKRFVIFVALLSLLFISPLWHMLKFAAGSEFFSYLPLIPVVSAFLLWKQKSVYARQTSKRGGLVALVAGSVALLFFVVTFRAGFSMHPQDRLALSLFAFVSFIAALYLFLLGKNLFNTEGFPVALLIFMVPLPTIAVQWVEWFFQICSAEMAQILLQISNAPFFRHGLAFRLPGITLQVAPECSGIRSTLVLLITSLIAGHLFLQSAWKKTVLALFIIPLAILRNGFRIFVIAQLCIQSGPEMINSSIHKRGGPIFFLLSLIPFFLLLFYLRKSDIIKPVTVHSKK